MNLAFSQKLRYARQVSAATANNKLTSSRLLSSLAMAMALDHHNIFYRLLKNETKLLALIEYS
jgi:hypothetical protein